MSGKLSVQVLQACQGMLLPSTQPLCQAWLLLGGETRQLLTRPHPNTLSARGRQPGPWEGTGKDDMGSE